MGGCGQRCVGSPRVPPPPAPACPACPAARTEQGVHDEVAPGQQQHGAAVVQPQPHAAGVHPDDVQRRVPDEVVAQPRLDDAGAHRLHQVNPVVQHAQGAVHALGDGHLPLAHQGHLARQVEQPHPRPRDGHAGQHAQAAPGERQLALQRAQVQHRVLHALAPRDLPAVKGLNRGEARVNRRLRGEVGWGVAREGCKMTAEPGRERWSGCGVLERGSGGGEIVARPVRTLPPKNASMPRRPALAPLGGGGGGRDSPAGALAASGA